MQIQIAAAKKDFGDQKQEDILIARDEHGTHLGTLTLHPYYSPDLEPAHPHNIALLFHPAEGAELTNSIKDELLASALRRAQEIKCETGLDKTRVYACYFKHQQQEIGYFLEKGFQQDERMLILEKKGSNQPGVKPLPEGVRLTDQLLAAASGMDQLIRSHQDVFPRQAYTSEQLEMLMTYPGWKNLTALSGNQLVGNIMVYADQSDQALGYLEDLFVHKDWRKQGIGQYLVGSGLDHLLSFGASRVQLELWSANQAALSLYQRFGFTPIKETEIAVGTII
jgi:ribosomal protein S18 acetylase RimI-like enzyme